MEKHFLDIDYKTNSFYQYSKVAQEGFEEYRNSAGELKGYRKLFLSGVYGILESVSVVDSKYQGKKLTLRMKNGDNIYLASFAMYDQRSNFDNKYVEPLITLLPNMKKGEAYRIFPWGMESDTIKRKDGTPRTFYGVSVVKADLDSEKVLEGDDNKITPVYTRKKKDETFDAKKHLPELKFEDDFGSYKPTLLSLDERKRFLKDVLTQSLETLGYKSNAETGNTPAKDNSPAVKQAPVSQTQEAKPTTVVAEDDYDDLPF